jgi:hypothetical protein
VMMRGEGGDGPDRPWWWCVARARRRLCRGPVHVGIFGENLSGKSTLLNAVLLSYVLPVLQLRSMHTHLTLDQSVKGAPPTSEPQSWSDAMGIALPTPASEAAIARPHRILRTVSFGPSSRATAVSPTQLDVSLTLPCMCTVASAASQRPHNALGGIRAGDQSADYPRLSWPRPSSTPPCVCCRWTGWLSV